jgi:type IV secretion system protein VirD4
VFKQRPDAQAPKPQVMSAYEDLAARETSWWTNDGLYMGFDIVPPADPAHLLRGDWICTGERRFYRGDRHIVSIGPNGSGKSRRLLIPNLYGLKRWSICAIDPKGELVAHTAAYRASQPDHKVIVIDPFRVVETNYPRLFAAHPLMLRSHGFNPMTMLEPFKLDIEGKPVLDNGKPVQHPRFVDAAKAIAEALIKTDNSRDPYWPMAAQALLKGLLLGLRLRLGPSASLKHLRHKLGLPPKEFSAYCKMLIDRHGEECSALGPSLSRFVEFQADNKELGAILGTALVQTDWLDSPEMQADLNSETFDFATLKTTETTVYLVLPPEFLASHGTWLRLMVTAILRPLLRSVEGRTVPVLFMLDEFAQLGQMEIIKDNYALMRGYGVKLWTVWQDLNQAKVLYDDWWESFVGNAGIVQSFAPQDMTTRRYLSELGDDRATWRDVQSFSGSGGMSVKSMSSSSSVSQTHIKEPLMYPYELGQMRQGWSVVFTQRGEVHRRYFPDADHELFEGVNTPMREARSNIG